MRLSDLAKVIPLEIVRDGEFLSLGLLSGKNSAMLACLHDPMRAGNWRTNENISCVLTSAHLAASVPANLGLAVAPEPREKFLDTQRYLGAETAFYGAAFESEISRDAVIDSSANVGPRNVRIGESCVVEAGAIILGRVSLESGSVIRAGAVIGAEGFHPVPYGDGVRNMPHHGSVRVGKGVEIGANSVICRSVFNNPTQIGDGTLIGPLVYVAHGVTVGRRCRIAASARICGSSTIGDGVTVGPNAVISNLVQVGDGATISIGSVVVRNVGAGQKVTGHFAVDHQQFIETWGRLFK
jgi:UDP-3-O-[3-hydroxymyristoyl] glucosamine N-acyltransferase